MYYIFSFIGSLTDEHHQIECSFAVWKVCKMYMLHSKFGILWQLSAGSVSVYYVLHTAMKHFFFRF